MKLKNSKKICYNNQIIKYIGFKASLLLHIFHLHNHRPLRMSYSIGFDLNNRKNLCHPKACTYFFHFSLLFTHI
jgi:hypothetical protein